MRGLILRRRINKAPALREGITRGQKVATQVVFRPERQDTSRLSTTNAAPNHMVTEMQMMKERMDFMMNALRGQVSSDLDDFFHRTDSSVTASVTLFPLPLKFQIPQVESYDGSKDPLDHLESFKTLMHLQGVVNEIMCKAFPTTLKGPARV